MATETATNDDHEDSRTKQSNVSSHAETIVFKIIFDTIVGGVVLAIAFASGSFMVFGITAIIVGIALLYFHVKVILTEVEKMIEEHTTVREQD